jgi:hypothetical protein
LITALALPMFPFAAAHIPRTPSRQISLSAGTGLAPLISSAITENPPNRVPDAFKTSGIAGAENALIASASLPISPWCAHKWLTDDTTALFSP